MDVSCAIDEAKECSANYASQYAIGAQTGTPNKTLFWNFVTLNMFVRILCRYECQEKNFCKKNKSLSLKHGSGICLCKEEVSRIIEQVKLLCSNCNFT